MDFGTQYHPQQGEIRSLDSFNMFNDDQMTCLLTIFRNEILQKIDENNKAVRKLVTETKQDIFRKLNNNAREFRSFRGNLTDILKTINLKSLDEASSSVASNEFISNNFFDETCGGYVEDKKPKQSRNARRKERLRERKKLEKKEGDNPVFYLGEQQSLLRDHRLLSDDSISVEIVPDEFHKFDDSSLPDDVDKSKKAKNKANDNYMSMKLLTDVALRVQMIYNRINYFAEFLPLVKNEDAINTDGEEIKPANIDEGRTEVVNNAGLETVNAANGDFNEASKVIPVDHNSKNIISEIKTGAIKKVFNEVPGKSLEVPASVPKGMDFEELEEIAKKLANVLDVKYEHQDVSVCTRQNSIVIQFKNEREFNKWRGAARDLMEKEKFSYDELLALEDVDVIHNTVKIECPICLMECNPGDGITLRECLHSFCRRCIIKTVEHNTEMEVSCPFAADDYVCTSVIQHREIKEVVPKELYEKYLDKTFSIVGNRLGNTVHCKTPDCRNFYICEQNIMSFYCESCKSTNCVPCKAVHTGMNCREYQDELKILSETDLKARETLRMFEKMIRGKEAMACPQCQVVVQKIEGCDWIQCSMCKTEICWATLGPRWGPAGRGDTSGGCQCKLNGSPCHPNCRNCH